MFRPILAIILPDAQPSHVTCGALSYQPCIHLTGQDLRSESEWLGSPGLASPRKDSVRSVHQHSGGTPQPSSVCMLSATAWGADHMSPISTPEAPHKLHGPLPTHPRSSTCPCSPRFLGTTCSSRHVWVSSSGGPDGLLLCLPQPLILPWPCLRLSVASPVALPPHHGKHSQISFLDT